MVLHCFQNELGFELSWHRQWLNPILPLIPLPRICLSAEKLYTIYTPLPLLMVSFQPSKLFILSSPDSIIHTLKGHLHQVAILQSPLRVNHSYLLWIYFILSHIILSHLHICFSLLDCKLLEYRNSIGFWSLSHHRFWNGLSQKEFSKKWGSEWETVNTWLLFHLSKLTYFWHLAWNN